MRMEKFFGITVCVKWLLCNERKGSETMKKIISLLLIVVMAVSLLSGVSLAADYEKPTECAQADAGVMVTTADDATVVYYFETLSSDVFVWARQ